MWRGILGLAAAAVAQQVDPNLLQDIFGGSGEGGGYSGGVGEVRDQGTVSVLLQLAQGDVATNVGDLPSYEHCSDYTERYGYECVPYYQCENGTIITDGAGLLDVRSTLHPEESKCPGPLDVCCRDPDFVPPPRPAPSYTPRCGRRNSEGLLGVRIQGFADSESQFGEWPHMCALLREETLEGEVTKVYQCGASLVGPGTVLTAAHCVDKLRGQPGRLVVRCGEWDTQAANEPRQHQDRRVEEVIVHPDFSPRNLRNDFALLFTEQEFELSPHVDTVCMPEPGQTFDFQTCIATGWGKDKFGAEGSYQVVMKEVELPVVQHAACEAGLRRTRLGRRFRLHPSFLCAGGEPGVDTCTGDGGSPLVCAEGPGGALVQAGLVAWGLGCGGDTPGVYAAVAEAACWLDMTATCRTAVSSGSFLSTFGYRAAACAPWLADWRAAGREAACPVRWREEVATLARVRDQGAAPDVPAGAINFG